MVSAPAAGSAGSKGKTRTSDASGRDSKATTGMSVTRGRREPPRLSRSALCTTKIPPRRSHTPAMAADSRTTNLAPDTGAAADEKYRPLFVLSPEPAWVYDRDTLAFLEDNVAAVIFNGCSLDVF